MTPFLYFFGISAMHSMLPTYVRPPLKGTQSCTYHRLHTNEPTSLGLQFKHQPHPLFAQGRGNQTLSLEVLTHLKCLVQFLESFVLRGREEKKQLQLVLLTSVKSQGWSWISRSQSVSGVTLAYLKRFWIAEEVQMYLYKNSFPVCSEIALADMAT